MTETDFTHYRQRFVTGLSQGDQPLPGAFGLARIGGLTGKLIAAGQAFAGDGSRWTHAFIVLDNGECIEAEPGGARIVPLQRYLDMEEVAFCDGPVQGWLRERHATEDTSVNSDPAAFAAYVEASVRSHIVGMARTLRGTPYGYLQYLAMGLVALGFESRLLEKLISNRRHMICSQLVDEVYRRAGIQLFDDGRLPQNVTPGDLAIRFGIG